MRAASDLKLNTQMRGHIELAVAASDGEVGIFVPLKQMRQTAMLAATVAVVRAGKIVVPVLNVLGHKMKPPAREALGQWIPVDETMELLDISGELNKDCVAQWLNELGDTQTPLVNESQVRLEHLDEDQQKLMMKVLRTYRDIVEPKGDCPPEAATGVLHHIDVQGHAPIQLKRRRHSVTEEEVINKEVNMMLDNKVIEPGDGVWGFSVVLVKKKDGSVRFCIDYRALNDVTKRDVYPLPRIDEIIEMLRGAEWFTILDLHAGYWQIGMAPEDKDKTAFVTRQGLFRFVRMPFGLMNAPSTFQRMMGLCAMRVDMDHRLGLSRRCGDLHERITGTTRS